MLDGDSGDIAVAASAASSSSCWAALRCGDRFRVSSQSGSDYEPVFLALGQEDAGLYVRLAGRTIARMSPDRLRADTFSRLLPDEVLHQGDELFVKPRAASEVRGALAGPISDRVTLRRRSGETVSFKLDELVSLKLAFRASDLRRGDEIVVMSRSGSEYRGDLMTMNGGRLGVRRPQGDTVDLVVERLDLRTLLVLVPLDRAALEA